MTRWTLIAPMLLLYACGGPPDALQAGTTIAAKGVKLADERADAHYKAEYPKRIEAAETAADLDDFEQTFQSVWRALGTAYESLSTVQYVLDSWGNFGDELRTHAVSDMLRALRDLGQALQDAGIPLPDMLESAIDKLASITGG